MESGVEKKRGEERKEGEEGKEGRRGDPNYHNQRSKTQPQTR